MQAAFPRARLIVFEKSGHDPFADEPERFFAELEKFVRGLRKPSADELAVWRKDIEKVSQSAASVIRKEVENYFQLPPYLNVNKTLASENGWGKKASRALAREYKPEWPTQIYRLDRLTSLRLGFALYDEKMYEEAVKVFKAGGNLMWQGHVLDLLGRRAEAIACYQKALDTGAGLRRTHTYSQYGVAESQEYIQPFLEKPFARIENNME
jgi:tetratricopeptide (TPR) repeat protein